MIFSDFMDSFISVPGVSFYVSLLSEEFYTFSNVSRSSILSSPLYKEFSFFSVSKFKFDYFLNRLTVFIFLDDN